MKYNSYLNSEGSIALSNNGFNQVITNIIEDDEAYITEDMKIDFFNYLQKYNTSSGDIVPYCDLFFDQSKKLKGKKVSNVIYNTELGRVVSVKSFIKNLKIAILNQRPSFFISDVNDEWLLNEIFIDSNDRLHVTENKFLGFLADSGIGDEKVQEHHMWTFEGLEDDDVYWKIEIKDLPCLLGLPGKERTEKDYNKIPRVTFSLKVPKSIPVHKPTSFDAGIMTVWRCGGKTKKHGDSDPKYVGLDGFEEYVHESINFNHINSNIYII